jgi:hypothetical protein
MHTYICYIHIPICITIYNKSCHLYQRDMFDTTNSAIFSFSSLSVLKQNTKGMAHTTTCILLIQHLFR